MANVPTLPDALDGDQPERTASHTPNSTSAKITRYRTRAIGPYSVRTRLRVFCISERDGETPRSTSTKGRYAIGRGIGAGDNVVAFEPTFRAYANPLRPASPVPA